MIAFGPAMTAHKWFDKAGTRFTVTVQSQAWLSACFSSRSGPAVEGADPS
jgi:hypothetical protein